MNARLSRRRFIQAGAAAGAGAALLPTLGCSRESDELNVVLVIIDSLRPDFVGSYGAPRVKTPTIDALAGQGLRFNRAFPEALVTVPARRSIFTGRRIFPYRDFEPVVDLGVSPGWTAIENLDQTLMKVLKDNGYWTAQVTDNPHTGFTETYKQFRLAWDRFVSVEGRTGTRNPPSTVSDAMVNRWLPAPLRKEERYVEGMKKNLANNGYGRDESESSAARVFKESIRALDEAVKKPQPFALVVDCFDPHEPWSPPRDYIEMYGDPDYEGPEIGVVKYGLSSYLATEEIRRLRAVYGGAVTMMDRWFGHFMERFRQLGLHENTAIVLLSDHGFLLGDRGWAGKIPEELHPELAQVPFIITHPERKAAGEVSDYFASTHDVSPTILSMLGIDQPRWMDGADLSVLLDGEQPPARPFHYGGMYNRYFIRTDQWVQLGDNLGGNRKLYDLTLDPGEFKDIHRQKRKLGEELFQQVIEATGGGPLPYYDDTELSENLQRKRDEAGFVRS